MKKIIARTIYMILMAPALILIGIAGLLLGCVEWIVHNK